MKLERWGGFKLSAAIAALLLATSFVCAGAASSADGFQKLDKAEFIRSDSATPPPDSAPWEAVTLPDIWDFARFGASGFAWYRLRFSIERVPRHQQVVYIPWMGTVGTVYVNGARQFQNGSVEEAGLWLPGFFAFRPDLLRPGTNTVHVRLWVKPGSGHGILSTVRLGAATRVTTDREHFIFMQRDVPVVVGVFSATIGLYMLLIWMQRRRDTMYAYFALAAITIAIYAIPSTPWGLDVPPDLALALARFKPAFLFICFLRVAGWRWPRTELAMWLLTTLVAGLQVGSYLDRSYELMLDATRYATLVTNGAATALALYIAWRLRTQDTLVLALGQSVSYGLLVLANLPLPILSEAGPHLGFFHIVPIFLAMGWILTRRFARSLNDAERLNADLEERVAQKHAELQRNYEQLEQMARQAAIAEERHRIMSDMHDGIGGQLISTLNLVKHGTSTKEVEGALQECLDDLRLIIDSLQPTDDDLLPVLGNLRYRLEGRLKRQGITLDWHVAEVPRLSCLTPQNVLQVLRILQEAFANIIKHAEASVVQVATSTEERGVRIDVSDDGKGFDETVGAKGRGLANMRRRAQAMGGELGLKSSATGTTLSLLLPV